MKFNIPAPAFIGQRKGFEFLGDKGLIGGQEVYLYDLAQFLIKEGHDVTVIQPWSKNEVFEIDDIEVKGIKLPNIVGSYLEFGFYWKKYIDKDADKVHIHWISDSLPFADKSMTGTCHGIEWDCPRFSSECDRTIYEMWTPSLKKWFMKYRVHYAIRHLNQIASVDGFLLKYIQSEYPMYRNKIKVIPNYVNLQIFNSEVNGTKIRNKYSKRTIILFPRNISYLRGIHIALSTIKNLSRRYPEILLLIVGNGPQKEWAVNYIRQNNLQDNVYLLGHKQHFKDMPELYAASDIVIIPSFCSEGTSLSCLEAMAMKKPVVSTNIGGLTDILVDKYNGLICEPTSESLSKNIELLLNDSLLKKNIANNASQWVTEQFSYDKWTNAYKDFFEI